MRRGTETVNIHERTQTNRVVLLDYFGLHSVASFSFEFYFVALELKGYIQPIRFLSQNDPEVYI